MADLERELLQQIAVEHRLYEILVTEGGQRGTWPRDRFECYLDWVVETANLDEKEIEAQARQLAAPFMGDVG